MDIIGKKYWYFGLSLLVVIPGLVFLLLFGLRLSIDFTGGSRLTLSFQDKVNEQAKTSVKNLLISQKISVASLETSNNIMFIRTSPIDQNQNNKFLDSLKNMKASQKEFETVGPTIGKEITASAVKAVMLASFLVVLYITWSFRSVPRPASSFRFGVCAIISLVHDVLVVIGIFAILGYLFHVEVDSLFVTAVLTIIGFSVHDTIVVFDRIRENLKKTSGSFDKIVNDSILQTLGRSLNTSLTVVLVLITLLLFGGESIRWFVVALLIGVISGTYSSIFNAAPILVVWHEWSQKRSKPGFGTQ